MLVEVKVPQLAESVTEATLLEWQKQQGDRVERGDNLIDIETDKVVLEVTAADSGVLKEIRKNSGEDVQSNDVIAIIDTEAGAAMARSAREPSTQAAEETPLGGEQQAQPQPSIKAERQLRQVAPEGAVSAPINGQADTACDQTMPSSDTGSMPAVDVDSEREARLGPAVRKLLQEHQLDPREIEGSGKDGRITKADVLSYLETQPAEEVQPQTQKIPRAPLLARGFEGRPERRAAMTRLRKRVAERLLQAQSENAILTTFNEVDMQPVLTLRKRYREQFEKVHGVRLGFMGFFVLASIEALKRFPIVNASVDGNDIIYHGYFDIGIAVSSPRGLVVPILRDAQRLS
ncbi:MAG TPA: 2-oxo acid dehydrogenase subunit E2, partial [Gammaproteobacteria bacterium]|nr:2-oxo acid dehydrogenase subunit E2 [Gammaproteobacteria bacterium]